MQRRTQQREAISRAIVDSRRPVSPAEILKVSRRAVPDIGIATVYRAIKDMLAEKRIVAVEVPGGPPRYESAGLPHHHHFLCRACDRLIDLPGCPGSLERLAPSGFAVEGHELTLIGRCAECRTPSSKRRASRVRRS